MRFSKTIETNKHILPPLVSPIVFDNPAHLYLKPSQTLTRIVNRLTTVPEMTSRFFVGFQRDSDPSRVEILLALCIAMCATYNFLHITQTRTHTTTHVCLHRKTIDTHTTYTYVECRSPQLRDAHNPSYELLVSEYSRRAIKYRMFVAASIRARDRVKTSPG